jgi:WD40 repeat protein
MDTKQVIARFAAERQALALMDHPNIAKVLDAGATETGRPYFVMELVKGIPITRYCDENNLNTERRLRLFVQVCQAIQHAHQKGIIHRDIKPSNILVADHDGVPVPKAIDFGIAKATTDQRLTDKTLFTAFEHFIGTPAYMSPEQAKLSGLDIDTRSDIYSLGVLLYELLTGKTPFEARELLEAGLDEMRRAIREKEPVRPSTRLSMMVEGELTTTAQRRQTDALRLLHLVRGDLDWIVMKCLEKDRNLRYDTANGLVMDIQRHLASEPVVARPPNRLYRFEKLVRRNRLAFSAIGAIATILVVGIVVSTWEAARATRAEREKTQLYDKAQTASRLLQMANQEMREQLRASYLAEARARRSSGRAGQRFASLEAVEKAGAIRPDLGARNEAIACLAMSDLRLWKQAKLKFPRRDPIVRYDASLEHYAIVNAEGNIVICAAADDRELAVLPAPDSAVVLVYEFSPNGQFIAVGYRNESDGDNGWVWDVTQRKAVLKKLPGYWRGEAFSPDSRLFMWSHPGGIVSVYELGSTREARRLDLGQEFNHFALSPNGTKLACTRDGDPTLEIREPQFGQLIRSAKAPADMYSLAWSPDGESVAAGCADGHVCIWNASDGRLQVALEGPPHPVTCVGFSRDSSLLASSGHDDITHLWDLNRGRQLVSHPGAGYQIQFSPEDRFLAPVVEGSEIGVLEVAHSREYRCLYSRSGGAGTSAPDFSPDGRIVVAGTSAGVCFLDVETGQEIGTFSPMGSSDATIFHPDGKSLITSERSGGVYLRPLQRVAGSSAPAYILAGPRALWRGTDLRGAALSQDGRHLAVVANHMDGEGLVLDLENPSMNVILRNHPLLDYIAISPDGHWAATGSWQNSIVKVWDARSGQLVRNLPMPARTRVTFSPDGRWLATCTTQYQLWEVGSWRPKNPPIPGHPLPHFNFIAFAPDSKVMAIGPEGRTIQLLETSTGRLLATLEGPDSGIIQAVRFSPGGGRLVALQADGHLLLWDLRLIRQQLKRMNLDWDLPPYLPVQVRPTTGPVSLTVEPSG